MTNSETEAIRRFQENRIDPISGKTWVLCSTSVTRTDVCRCDGCHQPVTLDSDGLWIYA
jgi:hypothetical protein